MYKSYICSESLSTRCTVCILSLTFMVSPQSTLADSELVALVSVPTPESGVTASSHTHSWIDTVFSVFALDKLALIKLILLIQQHKDHSRSPWTRRVKHMLTTVREMYLWQDQRLFKQRMGYSGNGMFVASNEF